MHLVIWWKLLNYLEDSVVMVISFMDFVCVEVLLEGTYGLSVCKSRPASHDLSEHFNIFILNKSSVSSSCYRERSKEP